MQFNPACLGNSPVALPTQQHQQHQQHQHQHNISNIPNIPNISHIPHIPNIPNIPPHIVNNIPTNHQQQQEYVNNLSTIPAFDASPSNAWSNSILNSFPLYGLFNNINNTNLTSSLVAAVAEAQPAPVPSPQDPKKKGSAKRFGGKDDTSPVGEDKSQADEEQRQKRQRRLMKNREAAQQFRHRQKEYIQNLERRVGELNTHVGDSHKHIELLTTENRLLRDQLVYLYNVMKQNLSPSGSPTSPAASPTVFTTIPNMPAPLPVPPQSIGMMDLGMLGFKGYVETFDHGTPASNYGSTPSSVAPSPIGSPITPRMPDMGVLSLSKVDLEDGMGNAALLAQLTARLGKEHDAQTVPELMVKSEGSGNM